MKKTFLTMGLLLSLKAGAVIDIFDINQKFSESLGTRGKANRLKIMNDERDPRGNFSLARICGITFDVFPVADLGGSRMKTLIDGAQAFLKSKAKDEIVGLAKGSAPKTPSSEKSFSDRLQWFESLLDREVRIRMLDLSLKNSFVDGKDIGKAEKRLAAEKAYAEAEQKTFSEGLRLGGLLGKTLRNLGEIDSGAKVTDASADELIRFSNIFYRMGSKVFIGKPALKKGAKTLKDFNSSDHPYFTKEDFEKLRLAIAKHQEAKKTPAGGGGGGCCGGGGAK